MNTPTRTRIDAGHIIAYDAQAGEHRYLRDGVIVVEGDSVVHVGKTFDGETDERIDATGQLVTPGFVNVHAHLAGSPLDKSFIEDRGPRQFYLSGLFELLPARGAGQDAEATQACFDYSMVELLRTGTTTILEMGPLLEEAIPSAVAAGIRLYLGPAIRDGRWYTDNGRTVRYDWDEAAGRAALRRAVEFIERHDGSHDGLIKGFLSPIQVDTCTRRAAARGPARGRPPARAGADPRQPVGQRVPGDGRAARQDADRVAANRSASSRPMSSSATRSSSAAAPGRTIRPTISGSSRAAAHRWRTPSGSSRGAASRWNRSRATWRRGCHMALGTDTAPQSMLEAMKFTRGRLEDRGSADRGRDRRRRLQRRDPRRGAGDRARRPRADRPRREGRPPLLRCREPLDDPAARPGQEHRLLGAGARPRRRDGQWQGRRCATGRCLASTSARSARRLQAGGERMWPAMARGHWDGRDADTLSPQSFPPVGRRERRQAGVAKGTVAECRLLVNSWCGFRQSPLSCHVCALLT